MALILTMHENWAVDVKHQIHIPKEKLDDVIAELTKAKENNTDITLNSEKFTVFLNYVKSMTQARIGIEGPKSFIISPIYNSKTGQSPPSRGIAG